MRFSLLVVFVYELRVIANPVPDSTASSSEDVFGSNGLISPLSDGSLDDDAAWNSDESTNGPFPSSDANERGPEGSGLALGSAEAPHSNDPTSAVKCDGSQSSSIIQGDPAMLTGRDLIDSFPETQELKAPSNDLLSEAKCPDPDSDAVPDMVPLDLLAPLPGFRGGECPPDFPVPLFCEGPWIGFDILVCSLCMFHRSVTSITRGGPKSDILVLC